MKKFVKNIFFFVIPFMFLLLIKKITFAYILRESKTAYALGESLFTSKLHYYQNNQKSFNTVFFGSSRIYRHVNPIIFDSVLVEKKICSFNFGTPSTVNPEVYFLYENFIKRIKNTQVKYAIIELSHFNNSIKNANTTKGSYWLTISNFTYCLEYIVYSSDSTIQKIRKTLACLEGILYNLFDFNILKETTLTKNIGINGFYPVEKELSDANSEVLKKRREAFQLSTIQLQEIVAGLKNSDVYLNAVKVNQIHYKRLKNLILKSKEKGIHLFYILPPRLKQRDYIELLPILKTLPQSNVIYLFEYEKHKSLYSVENSFDYGHLNTKGSNIFTKFLAKKISEKLNK